MSNFRKGLQDNWESQQKWVELNHQKPKFKPIESIMIQENKYCGTAVESLVLLIETLNTEKGVTYGGICERIEERFVVSFKKPVGIEIIKTHIENDIANNSPTLVFTDANGVEWVNEQQASCHGGFITNFVQKEKSWYFNLENKGKHLML